MKINIKNPIFFYLNKINIEERNETEMNGRFVLKSRMMNKEDRDDGAKPN